MGRSAEQIRRYHEAQKVQAIKIGIKNEAFQKANPNLPPLTATGRKVLKETGGDVAAAYAAQQKHNEADRIQAEQRARAGAVGAASEAIKQQEERAVAETQGTAIGTIQKDGAAPRTQDSIITTKQEPNKKGGVDYSVNLYENLGLTETLSGEHVSRKEGKGGSGNLLLLPSGLYYTEPVEQKNVKYGPEGKPATPLGAAMEKSLLSLEKFQKDTAHTPVEVLLGGGVGLGKAFLATSAFFLNLGTITGGLQKGKDPTHRLIDIPQTGPNILIENVLSGKGPNQAKADLISYTKGHGIQSTWGEFGEILLGAPGAKTIGKGVVKLLPIKLISPKVAVEGEVIQLSKSIGLGYGSKTVNILTKYPEVGFKWGKYQPETAIKAITSPTKLGPTGKSSFEVLPMADYSKAELKQIKPTLQVLEKEGILKPGKVEQVIEEGKTLIKATSSKPISKQLKKEYIGKRATNDLVDIHPGIKSKQTLIKLAQAQNKYLGVIKGSDVFKQLKRFPFGKNFKRGDIDLTASSMEKGTKAADLITTAGAKEPFMLGRIGTNVGIGKKGEPVWDLKEFIDFEKGSTVHGTNLQSAKSIEKGVRLDKGQRDLFFTTQNKKVIKTFQNKAIRALGGKPAVANVKVNPSDVLFFKKIPKRDRGKIISDDWMEFQNNLIGYAKSKGFKGATKPYHSTKESAPKYEMIIFDESAITSAKNIPPTRFLLKDAEKIINIINPKDELKNVAGLNPSGRFYGKKYPNDSFKQKVEGTRKKLKVIGLKQQTIDLNRSISGIISRGALKEGGLSDKQLSQILGKYEVTTGPLGHRYEKDILRGYLGNWKLAQVAFKTGKKDIAKEIGLQMGKRVTTEPSINWRSNLRGLLDDTSKIKVDVKTPAKDTPISNLLSASGASGKVLPKSIFTTEQRQQPIKVKSSYTKQITKSAYSPMVFKSPYRSIQRQSSTPSKLSSTSNKYQQSSFLSSQSSSSKSTTSKLKSSTSPISGGKSPLSFLSPPSGGPPSKITTSITTKSPIRLGKPPSGGRPSSLSRYSPILSYPKKTNIRPIILWKTEQQKRIDKDKAKIYPFIGNVPLTELVGVYAKKSETVYGSKKVKAFELFDIKETKKRKLFGFGSFKKTKKKTKKEPKYGWQKIAAFKYNKTRRQRI